MQNEHNPSCRYLGIDIGGTRIKWGVIDAKGTIVRRGLADTCPEKGAEYFLRTLCALVENAGPIEGVGICTAGIVDSHAGTVLGGIENIPFLKGMPLQSLLEQAAGCRARLLNDVNAAALGYCTLRGKTDATLCYLYFPRRYGPGAGFVLQGRPFCGAGGFAGEIGRLPLGADWKKLSWGAFSPVCHAVAMCAGTAAAFLDPEEIVLCGEMLNGTHLAQVRRQCAAMLAGPLPQFTLAKDFLEDYTAGVAGRALEALELALEAQL